MRMMLNEEIARAVLIGDGRLASDEDKISEDHVRPIVNDADLFTIKASVVTAANADDATKAKAFIRAAIKARKNYKGSGNPDLFTTEDWLTEMLLLEDNMGRPLYQSEQALATKLRVRNIVTVEVMENFRVQGVDPLMGIIVNLKDYTVGADKGGAINMFDDFDIDYNQQKYLIETRCSGALTVPYSAIVLTDGQRQGTSVAGGVKTSKTTYEEVTPVGTENPANLGWYEVNAAGKYVLTSDTTVTQNKDYYTRVSHISD
jgi:HK97 family phage major capsid protein